MASGFISDVSETLEPEINEYLYFLNDRIRGLRAARGMTRKHLSRHSSISERYLAQLESGRANPSVAVLWRIAGALGIDFRELVVGARDEDAIDADLLRLLQSVPRSARESTRQMLLDHLRTLGQSRKGVALIGLRGAGKSTLGRRLAEAINAPFFRLSERIKELGGMEIGELFSLGGQKAYRRLERQALEQIIESDPRSVLEVGGSLVSEPATFRLLRNSFHTIWLRAQPEDHMSRVIHQGDMRPMEGNAEAMADLRRILGEREHEYQRADYVLDTSGRNIDECMTRLISIADGCLETSRAGVSI